MSETFEDINTQSIDYRPGGNYATQSLYEMQQKNWERTREYQADLQRQTAQQAYYQSEIARLENERIALGASPEQIRKENEEMQNNLSSHLNELNNQLQTINQYTYGLSGSFLAGQDAVSNYVARNSVPEYNNNTYQSDSTNSNNEFTVTQEQLQDFQKQLNNLCGLSNPQINQETQSELTWENQTEQFNDLMNSLVYMMDQYFEYYGKINKPIELPEEPVEQPEDPIEKIQETKEYDQKAAEGLSMIFTQEVFDNWEKVSIQERADRVKAYAEYLNQSLGITISKIEFKELADKHWGTMYASENRMELNIKLLEDPEQLEKLIETITHESRHQLQYEAIQNPEKFPNISSETIASWKNNWNNYFNSSDDLEAYYKQPIEVDARKFAADVMQKANINNK